MKKIMPTYFSYRLGVASRLIGHDDAASNAGVLVNHVDACPVPGDDSQAWRRLFVQLGFEKLANSHH